MLCFGGLGLLELPMFRDSERRDANRDSGDLFKESAETWRLRLRPTLVPGSKEAVEYVSSGKTDLAFVQGGMPIPDELPRLRSPSDEVVLW